MIYSDRQLSVSQAELVNLKAVLETSTSGRGDREPWLADIENDALRSQIAEIESEIREYELLKSGQVAFSETCALSELPRVLVQARIAKGLSQSELANRLNMKPQQIQRYEATSYMSASLARLIEVATILDVKISESYETENKSTGSIFSWMEVSNIAWSRLPLREMLNRNWFQVRRGQSPLDAARNFFLSAAGPQFASAMHKKKIRSGSVPNEFALLAWQARILAVAREMQSNIKTFHHDDTWLNDLVSCTRMKDGPIRARNMLAEHGITLVIESHLQGTHLDGAAMLSADGQPVVALTLRHDRLDNFWFVLFHELGHVFLHLFDNLKFDFFDEEDGSESDILEREADRFALDTLIPPEKWDRCLSRFAISNEAVEIDAKSLGIDTSIVAGRIRKERNNYLILSDLVGQNTVRAQFGEFQK